MANIKQQKKRILIDIKRNMRNRIFKSKMRTALKKANDAIDKNLENKNEFFKNAIKILDKVLQKKIKKANFINRHKSRLNKKFNSHLVKEKILEKN